jgi:serine/threonine protein kinase
VIYGIALGMEYIQSHGVIHLDLRPWNVLLDSKIADFRVWKVMGRGNWIPALDFTQPL